MPDGQYRLLHWRLNPRAVTDMCMHGGFSHHQRSITYDEPALFLCQDMPFKQSSDKHCIFHVLGLICCLVADAPLRLSSTHHISDAAIMRTIMKNLGSAELGRRSSPLIVGVMHTDDLPVIRGSIGCILLMHQ